MDRDVAPLAQRFSFAEEPDDETVATAPPRTRPEHRTTSREVPSDPSGRRDGDLQERLESIRANTRPARERVRRPTLQPAWVPEDAPVQPNEMEEAEAPSPNADETLSVAQFYERVKRALRREFDDEVWVCGEIRQLRESRGHLFIELADAETLAGGSATVPQLEVACWARDWARCAPALRTAGVELEVGRVVRVRGRVSVWEGGSRLRFALSDIDVEALFGGIAAARRRLLARLDAEGLLEANRLVEVPAVPLRIGIVTSRGSEAHRDFVGQLDRSGFAFEVFLEPSLVQGPEAPAQIVTALGRLARRRVDLAVLVRGGGARGDLAAFDAEDVARGIAQAPFAVWTGIGHTSDRSVADMVANRSLITPTACGEAVVGRVSEYWETISRSRHDIVRLAAGRLDATGHRLHGTARELVGAVRHQLGRRQDELGSVRLDLVRTTVTTTTREEAHRRRALVELRQCSARLLGTETERLAQRRQVLAAFDPVRQLARGWSLTHDDKGRLVSSVAELRRGDRLLTRFADGCAESDVQMVREEKATPLLDSGER